MTSIVEAPAKLAVGALTTIVFIAISQTSSAQRMTEDVDQRIEEVVVTGTRLGDRTELDELPIDIFSAEDVFQSGSETPVEYLQKMPSVLGIGTKGRFAGGEGESFASLRALPSKNTLFLMNGMRIAQDGVNQSSNATAIPEELISRIEILKGGASTIYGSDAVAGVVNYILRDEVDGFEFSVNFGDTKDGGGENVSFSALAGNSTDTMSFFVGASYDRYDPIKLSSRSWIRMSDFQFETTETDPGVFQLPADLVAPGSPAGLYTLREGVVEATSPADFRLYEPANDTYFVDEETLGGDTENFSFFGRFLGTLGGVDFDGLLIYSRLEDDFPNPTSTITVDGGETAVLQPDGSFVTYNHIIPASNYWNQQIFGTNAVDITSWSSAFGEIGIPNAIFKRDEFQAAISLTGDLSQNWQWSTRYNYSSMVRLERFPWVDYLGLDNRLTLADENAFNPFVAGTTNRAQSGITTTPVNSASVLSAVGTVVPFDEDAEESILQVTVTSDLLEIANGPVGIVIGAEYRDQLIDRKLGPTATSTFGSVGWATDRQIASLFSEVEIPILENLTANVSARYDDYDLGEETAGFSSTVTAVSFRWEPIEKLKLRGGFSEGFVAPTSADADRIQQIAIDNFLIDPRDGQIFELETLTFKGNPELSPEESDIYDLGIAYSIGEQNPFDIEIDYFLIETSNLTTEPNEQFVLDANFAGGGPQNPDAPFADAISFDAIRDIYTNIDVVPRNIGERTVEGIDFGIGKGFGTTVGDITTSLRATTYLEYSVVDLNGVKTDFAGTSNFDDSPIPDWKAHGVVGWSLNSWFGKLAATYISSFDEGTISIDDYLSVDLFVSKGFSFAGDEDAITVGIGIDNVFDESPPISPRQFLGFYRSIYDLRGRFGYASVNVRF